MGFIFLLDAYIDFSPIDTISRVPTISDSGSTALITGSTDGIGVTTSRNILIGNADSHSNCVQRVLIHGRKKNRIRSVTDSIDGSVAAVARSTARTTTTTVAKAVALPASDLSTTKGCYDLVKNVKKECQATEPSKASELKILVNNAGVYSDRLVRTKDGLELTFAVNVLAPFVITSMLLSTLLASGSKNSDEHLAGGGSSGSRIVIASSVTQSEKLPEGYWDDPQCRKRTYKGQDAYAETKLLDAMLTIEMAHRLEQAGIDPSIITCNCLDPGTIRNKRMLEGWGPFGINSSEALDEAWCCTSPELNRVSGRYFVARSPHRASRCAYDARHRNKLWQTLSELAPEAAAEWDRAVQAYAATT